ncbi:DUF6636 domain-containing protein [Paraconexibacter sp. AEG42_29]|uniref:DUF6636 domain-containing protein n=1 Tax=Paraconexibacter sp. AEG42_29 TaxID=2997339 RepID=UPI00339D6F97
MTPTISVRTASLLTIGLALVASGCGGDGAATVTVAAKPTTVTITEATGAGQESGKIVEVPGSGSVEPSEAVRPSPVDDLTSFASPSRNIGCAVGPSYARCDIKTKSWSAPAKPASCEYDYGQGLEVTSAGAGRVVCAGDTALPPPGLRRLAYGQSVTRGGITCTSRTSGVTCRNGRGHGFTLSAQTYDVF